MSDQRSHIPRLPFFANFAARPLPLPVLTWLANRLARQCVTRHPSLFSRLGTHASKDFLIDPVDLPFVFLVQPIPDAPRISVHRRGKTPSYDGRIDGPLAALLGMVHGAYDGDALFFSRDIELAGDTAAVLAFRNAIDDCELDLFEEILVMLGAAGRFARPSLTPIVGMVQKQFGVALRKVELSS